MTAGVQAGHHEKAMATGSPPVFTVQDCHHPNWVLAIPFNGG